MTNKKWVLLTVYLFLLFVDVSTTYAIFLEDNTLRDGNAIINWLKTDSVHLVWLYVPFMMCVMGLLNFFTNKFRLFVEFRVIVLLYIALSLNAIAGNSTWIIRLYF